MSLKLKKTVLVAAAFGISVIALVLIIRAFLPAPFAGYADGTYYGEAKGIRKHLKTEVVVLDERIVSIEIIEHYEKGSHHYKLPMEQLPSEIITKQSLEVDIVAGSTMTCNGIIDSVANALEKAKDKSE